MIREQLVRCGTSMVQCVNILLLPTVNAAKGLRESWNCQRFWTLEQLSTCTRVQEYIVFMLIQNVLLSFHCCFCLACYYIVMLLNGVVWRLNLFYQSLSTRNYDWYAKMTVRTISGSKRVNVCTPPILRSWNGFELEFFSNWYKTIQYYTINS